MDFPVGCGRVVAADRTAGVPKQLGLAGRLPSCGPSGQADSKRTGCESVASMTQPQGPEQHLRRLASLFRFGGRPRRFRLSFFFLSGPTA